MHRLVWLVRFLFLFIKSFIYPLTKYMYMNLNEYTQEAQFTSVYVPLDGQELPHNIAGGGTEEKRFCPRPSWSWQEGPNDGVCKCGPSSSLSPSAWYPPLIVSIKSSRTNCTCTSRSNTNMVYTAYSIYLLVILFPHQNFPFWWVSISVWIHLKIY